MSVQLDKKRIQLNFTSTVAGLEVKYACNIIDNALSGNIIANVFKDEMNSLGNVYTSDGETVKVELTLSDEDIKVLLDGIKIDFLEIIANLNNY